MIFAWIIAIIASILLLTTTIALLRAKDVFVMLHLILISNFYIFPLIFLSLLIKNFSLIALAKITIIILLNIIATNLICHVIARRAIANKITPDADFNTKVR